MSALDIFMILRLQIGCLCITVAVAIPFFAIKRTIGFANRLFRFVLLFQFISLAFDMITVCTVNNLYSIPPALNKLFHVIFICSLCLFQYLVFIYIRQLTTEDNRKKVLFAYGVPVIISMLVTALTPLRYEETEYGNYSVGPGATVVYGIVGIYLLMMLFALLRHWKMIDSDKRRIILISLLTEICISLTQSMMPTLLISSLGTTIITLTVYLTIENPDRMLRQLYLEEKLSAEAAKLKIEEIAYTDALTGIMNRRQFLSLAATQIERVMRQKSSAYMIIFDIDHFKEVNDTFGHLVGDKVLKCLAEKVTKAVRPYDLFGRYGGEEFIIFVSDIGLEDVQHHAERLRLAICAEPMVIEDVSLTISASFGVAPVLSNDLDEIIRAADEALYEAKGTGRNKVVFK